MLKTITSGMVLQRVKVIHKLKSLRDEGSNSGSADNRNKQREKVMAWDLKLVGFVWLVFCCCYCCFGRGRERENCLEMAVSHKDTFPTSRSSKRLEAGRRDNSHISEDCREESVISGNSGFCLSQMKWSFTDEAEGAGHFVGNWFEFERAQ